MWGAWRWDEQTHTVSTAGTVKVTHSYSSRCHIKQNHRESLNPVRLPLPCRFCNNIATHSPALPTAFIAYCLYL